MQMFPRIAFVVDSLRCGGIERAAISLMQSLINEGADITLIMREKTGEYLSRVPVGITIMEIPYRREAQLIMRLGWKRYIINLIREGKVWAALPLVFNRLRMLAMGHSSRFLKEEEFLHEGAQLFCGEYDVAISFAELKTLFFVSKSINAKRKYLWLHTALDKRWCDLTVWRDLICKMDRLYCVSKALYDNSKKMFYEISDKIYLYRHIVDGTMLNEEAKCQEIHWPLKESQKVRILSVGRLDFAKGFDLIPDVVGKLKSEGVDVSWRIVGEGDQRKTIEKKIAEKHLSDSIMLVGSTGNPAPYYKACDIYVQPSRWEGYCLTLAEARKFALPIIATSFNGAMEQLDNGRLGVVVKNCNATDIFEALFSMINSPDAQARYREALLPAILSKEGGIGISDLLCD